MEICKVALLTRCKDEFFIKEFCDHYLNEGVDHIYIIDDDSLDKSIYSNIKSEKVTIIYDEKIISKDKANDIYKKIKDNYKWMIYVDVDEFIIPKRQKDKTIKQELETTFKNFDCIKIPWVFFSSSGRALNPKSIILENNTRWDHDKEHPNKIHKFRCRKEKIEVKCIFKTSKFSKIKDHHPLKDDHEKLKIVNSIDLGEEDLDPFYKNLNENKISNSFLICCHYRIISKENSKNKLKNNYWYKRNNYSLNELNLSDHSEIIDNDLRIRKLISLNKNPLFIHIGKCGGSYLRNKFKGLEFVHAKKASYKKDNKYTYIFSLRNPLNRFISAFNQSKSLATFPYQDKSYEELFNEKSSPFYQLKNKCFYAKNTNNPFGEFGEVGLEYLNLVSHFNSANELAESLTSSNINLREKASKLVTLEIAHIARGIGWHLDNGKFVEENHSRIIYCEDLKNIDYKLISRITRLEISKSEYRSENNFFSDNYLSITAINNIKRLYEGTDYKALKTLSKFNLISKDLLSSYYEYKQ